ncbi:response regulator, partial [Aeromonas hydrophila]|uniref:response regulator n=1 Tax=Aeromonas hydrophila TaxID=644 RepID=UPI003BF58775
MPPQPPPPTRRHRGTERQTPTPPPLYLVDDDEAVLDSLRFMLESCDERQLFSFADGERFLAEVDLHQPACLILDCRMPG